MTIQTIKRPHGFPMNSLPEPEKVPGYIFQGWYTEREGGELVDENFIVNGDVTLYAHWVVDEDYEEDYSSGSQLIGPKTPALRGLIR